MIYANKNVLDRVPRVIRKGADCSVPFQEKKSDMKEKQLPKHELSVRNNNFVTTVGSVIVVNVFFDVFSLTQGVAHYFCEEFVGLCEGVAVFAGVYSIYSCFVRFGDEHSAVEAYECVVEEVDIRVAPDSDYFFGSEYVRETAVDDIPCLQSIV